MTPLIFVALTGTGLRPPWSWAWLESATFVVVAAVVYGTRGRRLDAEATGPPLAVFEHAEAELIFETDARGVITAVRGATQTIVGYTPEQLLGSSLHDFVEGPVPFLDPEAADHCPTRSWDARWTHADGSALVLGTTLRPLASGGIRALVHDQRDRLAAERALRESEERFRTALDTARNGIMLVAADGRLLLANEALRVLLGHPAAAMPALRLADIVPPSHLDRVLALMASRVWADAASAQYEVQLQNAAGQLLDVEVALSPVRTDGRNSGVLIEVHDLTETRRASETIRYMADYDRLTGLPNRELFDRHVQRALVDARHAGRLVAVLMVDLDRFKLINDTLGHPSGDRLLKAVADRLRAQLPTQQVVARFGGDEFLVLVPDLGSVAAAEGAAKRVLAVFQQLFQHDGHALKLSASAGLALSTPALGDADLLIRVADAALHQAKTEGRDRYVVGRESASEPARARLALEGDLRRAVEQGQLEIYYQPQVDARTAEVRGVEALLRWQHPQHGAISPAEFVPLLEESGLIVPVGEWVLRVASAQVHRWHASGLTNARLAVNLSPRQLLVPHLGATVRAILAETGLAPEALELELTETAAMLDLEAVLGVLHELQAIGVTTAIDDFGVGQSWFVRLKEFPVRTLKVDRYFVAGVDTSPNALAIVQAIVALGHALGLEIVAEGVETAGELAAIRATGCDLVQGFFYAPALPAGELEALLAAGDPLAQAA